MNKDQIQGTAKKVAGKIQESVGKVTGSKKQQAKGLAKQVTGKAQESYGDAKQMARDAGKRY